MDCPLNPTLNTFIKYCRVAQRYRDGSVKFSESMFWFEYGQIIIIFFLNDFSNVTRKVLGSLFAI